jgi:hypothetical protein
MSSTSPLTPDRSEVLEKWFKGIAETYPRVTATFLRNQGDRFRNPVGHAISEAIGPIYDQVVTAMNEEVLSDALEGILKVRAVQDFRASEAVGFVFALKSVIRGVVGPESLDPHWIAEIDARIDRVALLAFDKYSECRERLHEIRANEIKTRWMRLLERAGFLPATRGDQMERGTQEDRMGGGSVK